MLFPDMLKVICIISNLKELWTKPSWSKHVSLKQNSVLEVSYGHSLGSLLGNHAIWFIKMKKKKKR